MDGAVNTAMMVNEFLEWMESRLEHHNKAYKEAKFANQNYAYLKSERTECEVCLNNFKSIFGLNTDSLHPKQNETMPTNTFHVPQNGTIEDAVAIIQPGGIIKISAGRYLLKETLLIEKPLKLEGNGAEKTVVVSTSNSDLIRVKISGKFSVEGICFQLDDNPEPSQGDDNTEPSSSVLRIDAGIADVFNCKFIGHENFKAHGIALYGESRGYIKGNEVKNFYFGISSRMDAYAELIGNHCEGNHSGIAFFGSSSGSVSDNFCRLSTKCGILVRDNAFPEICGNRCDENYFGVAFFGSSSGSAKENVCRLNKAFGIVVADEASPEISGNSCEENQTGVAFFGSSSGSAKENVCRLNKGFGIMVSEEASPEISGNRCEENDTGVVFTGSSSGSATENVCRLNRTFGIDVSEEAFPEISRNRCEENHFGISFRASASGSATDNICRLNEFDGISVSEEASPEISGNHCEENNTRVGFSDSTSGLTYAGTTKIQSDQSKIIEIDDNVLAWIDESTNLMWEVKNRDNANYMYAWHKRYVKTAQMPSSGPFEIEIKDAASYVERLNANKYAGFSDWRLPVIEELESLIDYDCDNLLKADGDKRFIKRPLKHNAAPANWTDTPTLVVDVFRPKGTAPYSDWKNTAAVSEIKIVDFTKPIVGGYNPDYTLWVRCVRSNSI